MWEERLVNISALLIFLPKRFFLLGKYFWFIGGDKLTEDSFSRDGDDWDIFSVFLFW